jgi:protein-arginine kinase activator protein McsA
VQPCPVCGEALGGGYAGCSTCHAAIESIWLADWQALLDQEGITPDSPDEEQLARVVLSEYEHHPWTVVDIAMSLLKCSLCGSELGERYSDCAECGMAFGSSILAEVGATANEHALHIGRWVLRYPQSATRPMPSPAGG